MPNKVLFKDKVDVTFGTGEGRLALGGFAVPFHVGAEVGPLGEACVADGTSERFVSGVNSHVRLKRRLIFEPPAADRAAHRLLCDVGHSDVLPQRLQVTELCAALSAAVDFTFCVD